MRSLVFFICPGYQFIFSIAGTSCTSKKGPCCEDPSFCYLASLDLIRIRVNDEVPDYIPNANDAEEKFEESSGIYKYDTVYYSKDVRTRAEHKNTKQNTTKLEDNRVFTHRNIIEIYPMYISKRSKEIDCVRDIHNLRSSSIQYEAGKTVLPMPLHLAKLLEEYFIQYKSR